MKKMKKLLLLMTCSFILLGTTACGSENNADNVSLYAVASHTSGEGYSGKSMSEQSIGFSEYEILEYAFLEYYGNEDGKEITIKIDW